MTREIRGSEDLLRNRGGRSLCGSTPRLSTGVQLRLVVTRRPPIGEIPRIGDQELERLYEELRAAHEENLKGLGVKLPKFRRNGLYTKSALALIGLYSRFGQPVTKDELEEFIAKYTEGARDGQQGRHLGGQSGWAVLSTDRPDRGTEDWPKPSYALVSLTDKHPSFRQHRDGVVGESEWDSLKIQFRNRCSLCGSEEGDNNLRDPSVVTRLEKGHRDPTKPLSAGNCLPQCQQCNGPMKEGFIFDKRGRPRAIARADLILKSPDDVQREVLRLLIERFEEGVAESLSE